MDEATFYAKEMIENQVNQKKIMNIFEPFNTVNNRYNKRY